MTIEGGSDAHSEHVHFHQLHIVKTGRIALFLACAAGLARVAIKQLLLSGVHPVSVACFILRFDNRELVATAIDCRMASIQPVATAHSL